MWNDFCFEMANYITNFLKNKHKNQANQIKTKLRLTQNHNLKHSLLIWVSPQDWLNCGFTYYHRRKPYTLGHFWQFAKWSWLNFQDYLTNLKKFDDLNFWLENDNLAHATKQHISTTGTWRPSYRDL